MAGKVVGVAGKVVLEAAAEGGVAQVCLLSGVEGQKNLRSRLRIIRLK